MPLLNYTTKIPAARTVGEIQGILAGHGAKAILIEYDDKGSVQALSFKVDTPHGEVGIRLPVDPNAVMRVLQRQLCHSRVRLDRGRAIMIAWRIVKDWVEAQMAILETEMVQLDQIFLPYIITPSGKSLYEAIIDAKFQLVEGKGESEEDNVLH